MNKYAFAVGLATILGFLALTSPVQAADLKDVNSKPADSKQYDLVVYGGTSGGVIAAVQAAKLGKSVVLIEPGKHLGGLTSGGLGSTDIGNKGAIGGLSREFYQRLGKHYGQDEAWRFEPHVAERTMDQLVAEQPLITTVREQRLDLDAGVKKQNGRIESIRMESGQVYRGQMFIDATYEGDLLAKAGVSYHVGREANATYNETLNGVQTKRAVSHQFKVPVDPYIVPGDPKSGLLPNIHDGEPGTEGSGDHRVQAYNFRMCLTNVPENRIPFPKPEGYNPLDYELLLRYIQAGVFDAFHLSTPMPNGKTDTNNHGAFSTDYIGGNYDYPEGDYATREQIFKDHVRYQQGLMWFLVNDPRLPKEVREQMGHWGLTKDEFQATGGWPHQLYVREARRMISDYVMTQQNCQGLEMVDDPVGLAAYTMDSHNTQRYVKDGLAINEGDVQVGGFHPYPIAYRSIVPKKSECENLLVPVCLSSSHIAFGSIRMEPVFMVLGQSAATAAVHAIDQGKAVQDIDVQKLMAQLKDEGQVLEWTGPKRTPPILASQLAGIVVDDEDENAQLSGGWSHSASIGGFVGTFYRHDANVLKGQLSARYLVPVAKAGKYDVRISYPANPNRATNVPVTVSAGDQSFTKKVDQRKSPTIDNRFVSVGSIEAAANSTVEVVISNQGTNGHVIADAVQLVPVE